MASKDIEVMSMVTLLRRTSHGSSLKILDVYELAVKYGKDKLMFGSDMPSPQLIHH